jgi:hypothetical protein
MSGLDIFTVNNFDVNRISFSDLKDRDGKKTVFINYQKENGEVVPLYLQTPKMYAPFGASAPPAKFDTKKWGLSMSFKSTDSTEELTKFEKLVGDIDTYIKNHGKKMAASYFPELDPADLDVTFKSSYNRLLKPGKVGTDYPCTIAPKVNVTEDPTTKEQTFHTKVYDTSKNLMKFSSVTKGTNVIGILRINSLYFAGKTNWGVTLSLPQLLVFPNKKLDGFQIQVDDSELEKPDEMNGSAEPAFEFED